MIYVSIVSHAHFALIREIGCLAKLKDSKVIKIIIRDNVGEIGFESWCNSFGFHYSCNPSQHGFGKNNNLNFAQAKLSGCQDGDYFLVLNPDVDCSEEDILNVADRMAKNKIGLATLNLFLDKNHIEIDNCARRFPGLWDFVSSYFFGVNHSIIDKSHLDAVSSVDWAAGSFLMFSALTYAELQGFDEGYFMYCEDIDICLRYHRKFNSRVVLFSDIFAVHYAQKRNRNLFSMHFLWHLKSCCRYLIKFYAP